MRRTVIATCIVAMLSGCLVGPDYVRPKIDEPARFRFEEADARDVVNTAWWDQFNDPVLNDLIGIALAENKDVRIAAARVEEFAGRLGTTRSQLFPQFSGDAGVARQEASRFSGTTTLPREVDRTFTTYQWALTGAWEIDFFGRLRRATEAARADLLASDEGRRQVILTLVSAVAFQYLNLCDLDKQLVISKRTADSRRESVDLFNLRYAGGVISELELSQVKSQYEEALATIPLIEKLIVQQENALSVLLGRDPGPIPRGRTLDELALPEVPAGLPSQLLERRPDLLQAELLLVSANAQIGAAKALYFPVISLTGQYGAFSTQLNRLTSSDARTWAFGPTITLPIFTAGAIRGQVAQAEALQQQALSSYQKAIQTAFQETEDALVDRSKSLERLSVQGRQVEALSNYARLAKLRFDNGYTSYLEVLDAQRSLFNAELNYTSTQADVFQALVNIYTAMGGGWVVIADQSTPPPKVDVTENPPIFP